MGENEKEPIEKLDFKEFKFQILIMGIAGIGAAIFGYVQLSFFNTYIAHVLELSSFHIALMVSLAAIVGLIFLLVWGVISDNTRSKFGRRRPYFLLGIISGIAMILFGFVDNFLIGLILRVVVLEITINAYYAVQRCLVADLIPIEHRGKTNAIGTNIGLIGMLVAVAGTVYANSVYVSGGKLSQEGHLFLYLIAGLSIIICALISFIFLKEPSVTELPPKKTFKEDLKETFQIEELKKHKEYFKMMLAQSVFFLGLLLVAPYIFIYVFGLELTDMEWLIVVLFMIPILGGSTFLLGILADKIGRKKIIPPVILLSCIGFWMVPFVATQEYRNLPLMIIALNLALIGFIGVMIPLNAWQQDLLPEDKRAQFNGIMNIVYTLLTIPGAILGAIIITVLGIHWIFFFVPFFFLASIPFFLRVKETLITEK